MNLQKTIDNKSYVSTGKFTGRSPKDRFIVLSPSTQSTVEWNKINQPLSLDIFNKIKEKYIKNKSFLYKEIREVGNINFTLHTNIEWAKLFYNNMTSIPISEEEEWNIYHMPEVECEFTSNSNCTVINFETKEIVICYSAYTGEIKKSIFSVLNFILPKEGILPMHCSANAGTKDGNDVALFFGLSGTGKTTLSSDPNRFFIGDDEHGWNPDNTIFNFEGGCYAKIINHDPSKEPVIDSAINKEGALFENVVIKDRYIDYNDASITQNTRVSYPLNNIDSSVMVNDVRRGKEVKNIFFLSYDAFGVLPPIMLFKDNQQAKKYFKLGYTSKVAGTEVGVNEPQVVFSPCFGAPFFPLYIEKYVEMFDKFITNNNVKVWMINTGLNGKKERFSINFTRDLINLALSGDYSKEEQISPFGGVIPNRMGSYTNELFPINYWEENNYLNTIASLKERFHNYEISNS
jgi:phosphoenolpyruvate carboxykinase (ATP)